MGVIKVMLKAKAISVVKKMIDNVDSVDETMSKLEEVTSGNLMEREMFECSMINPILFKRRISKGDIYTWDDEYASITAEVKYGRWMQDGSASEYSGTPCFGWYFEMIDLKPCEWADDTKEEILEYYPSYYKTRSLLEVLEDAEREFSIYKLKKVEKIIC